MTDQEAIEELKCDNEHCFDQCEGACASIKNYKCNCQDAIIERMLDKLLQYRKIGTVEECREAVEKQKAKKPVLRNDNGKLRKSCPVCGCFFSPLSRSCPKCGQAIQWDENLGGMEDEQS